MNLKLIFVKVITFATTFILKDMLLLFHITDVFDGLFKGLLLCLLILTIVIIVNPLLDQRQKFSVIV